MSNRPRPWRAADGSQLHADDVLAGLAADFTVSTGPAEAVRRTELDTFDRRLRDAGLTLEHHASTTTDRLVLDGAGGSTQVPGSGATWPAMADALPEGAVRDTVARASGIRALMVVSEERRRLRRVELRNRDHKVVVRLTLDEPASRRSPRPAAVVLHPLRGYDKEARQAASALSALGLQQAPETDARPDAEPPSTASADRATPAVELLALELREFLDAMQANLPGLLDDIDTEFLHDFRVAVRRTRSTLRLGRSVLPAVTRTRWEPSFKWLGELTTPVRDLDVYELALPTMAAWLVAADPADLDPFAAHLRRRRTRARRSLVRGLRSARYRQLVADWSSELERMTEQVDRSSDSVQPVSAGELADRDLNRAYRRVFRLGAAITDDSPSEALHSLRKRGKELRYAIEVFAPIIDPDTRKRAVADLKGLQDVLGRYQDSEVQRVALRGFAEEMMAEGAAAETLLAMGELVGHLDAEQVQARAEFAAAFARFSRPANDRRMRRLGGRV